MLSNSFRNREILSFNLILIVFCFVVKNYGNPINKNIDIGISFLGFVLFIVTGALILVEWSRNDVERIKKCLPITDNYSTNESIVKKIINFLTHAAADSVASKLNNMGIKNFLFSSEIRIMAVTKASLSIINGIFFIFDIILTHNFQGSSKQDLKTAASTNNVNI